ncbi:hypothetical protein HHI36_005687, partial [Cryptolaemus montrouzieri]
LRTCLSTTQSEPEWSAGFYVISWGRGDILGVTGIAQLFRPGPPASPPGGAGAIREWELRGALVATDSPSLSPDRLACPRRLLRQNQSVCLFRGVHT